MQPTKPALDLTTLNVAQKVAVDALKAYVCDQEQQAVDAGLRRDYQAAKLHKDWAFAGDTCVYQVSAALGQLFLQALNSPPLKSHDTVELPPLERTPDEAAVKLATVHVLRPDQPEPPAS